MPDDPDEPTAPDSVGVSPQAARHVEAHGGVLYVWGDDAGLLRNRTKPPSEPYGWVAFNTAGIEIRFAPELSAIGGWKVGLRRLPWKHVDVASSQLQRASVIDALHT